MDQFLIMGYRHVLLFESPSLALERLRVPGPAD